MHHNATKGGHGQVFIIDDRVLMLFKDKGPSFEESTTSKLRYKLVLNLNLLNFRYTSSYFSSLLSPCLEP